jgi:hypothetical protein
MCAPHRWRTFDEIEPVWQEDCQQRAHRRVEHRVDGRVVDQESLRLSGRETHCELVIPIGGFDSYYHAG